MKPHDPVEVLLGPNEWLPGILMSVSDAEKPIFQVAVLQWAEWEPHDPNDENDCDCPKPAPTNLTDPPPCSHGEWHVPIAIRYQNEVRTPP